MFASKRRLKIIGIFLIVAGLAVVAYPAYTFYFTNKAQSDLEEGWEQYRQARTQEDNGEKEVPPDTDDSTENASHQKDRNEILAKLRETSIEPAFRLIIPEIELDIIVVEGTDYIYLKYGPGHMKDSANPGEKGTCVISGHRTTYGAPFYYLHKLKEGDEIIIETVEERFVYLVERIASVKPSNLSILNPTAEPTLVLTTCTPIRSAAERLVIFADFDEEQALY